MSTSEQELRGQIAGMRDALRSARASARAGRVVGILGVLVGLCVVAAYVYAFFSLGNEVAHSKELPKVLQERVRQLQIENTLTKVAQDAYPVFLEEGRNLLKEMDLLTLVRSEFELARADIEPIARVELERVAPRLQKMLVAQKDQTFADMQSRLEKKLGDRLTSTVQRQESRMSDELGLDEESLAQFITNLQDACLGALRKVVEQRMGNVKEEMDKIVKHVAQLPALPASSREAVLNEMVLVLVALLRENLPAYADVNLTAPAVGKTSAAATPENREAAWEAEAAEAKRRVEEAKARREAPNE